MNWKVEVVVVVVVVVIVVVVVVVVVVFFLFPTEYNNDGYAPVIRSKMAISDRHVHIHADKTDISR